MADADYYPATADLVRYSGRLAVQQRVLPAYRAPFFDALAAACQKGCSVFAGQPQPDEGISSARDLETADLVAAENQHFLSVGSPFYQCRQPGLLEWLESSQPNVLIVEANPRNRSTPQAVRWMHARRRPVLGWGLGAPRLSGWSAALRQRERRRFLEPLDGIIAYSRSGADEYRSMGFASECIFVAPNAVAHRPTAAPPARRPIEGRKINILFVGRLQARKRIDNLLRACAALPAERQPQVCIVGEGPAAAEFQAQARQVYPEAEFPGAKYGAELEAFFTRADLFVLPGTGGLAVQQAMSFALPVIVAEGDGTQSDLVRNTNGWRIPPDDLKALTAALEQAVTNPQRLALMGAESYRIVSEEVNIETMVAAFVGALNGVQSRCTK